MSQEILQRAWELLILSAEDHAKLSEKRGFSDETIQQLGFRSSNAANKNILVHLQDQFPPEDLVRAGIYRKTSEGYSPQPQLCGYGLTGQKDEHGKAIWRHGVNPIIIPYFDEDKKVTALRPHKGNFPRPGHIDKWDEEYVGLHIYCPFLLGTADQNPHFDPQHLGLCVLTEGEFKAAALWQTGIPALAVPGIQSVRNPAFKQHLLELLKAHNITSVIVVFDNECKDDPALPNYKPDPFDRYDTIVYARYTVSTLAKEIDTVKFGWLPDAWRQNGKADWDGALADFCRQATNVTGGTRAARREFLTVLETASSDRDTFALFPSASQRIIECKLSRLFHKPRCLFGDDKVVDLARDIRDIPHPDAGPFADALMAVKGCYFIRKPLAPSRIKDVAEQRQKAYDEKNWKWFRFFKELALGMPERISNFVLKCDYKFHNAASQLEYLVRAQNIHNEGTEMHVRITPESMASLKSFRKWAIDHKSTWAGGERDLQDLTADMQAHSAFREIYEMDHYGHCEAEGLWIFGDRAYTSAGQLILPDKNLVFWHEGIGYQTDFDQAKIGHHALQGAPILGDLNPADAAKTFALFATHLRDAIGDFDAWLALGQVLSYACHAEIYKTYMGAPGLWITGRRGGGKSTIVLWLMRIWGYQGKRVALTADTTYNAIARDLSKYSCLPAWYDEFREHETEPRIQAMLKNAYDRSAGAKATMDATTRTRSILPRTTPIITGESSSSDAATRSRYVNISMLDERSKGKGDPTARLNTMNANAHLFCNLGHFLIANRAKYAERLLWHMQSWHENPGVKEFVTKSRERFVYGSAVAGFLATAELLNEKFPEIMSPFLSQEGAFLDYAMAYAGESQREVIETSFVATFWQDILNLVYLGKDAHHYLYLRYAHVSEADRSIVDYGLHKTADRTIPVMYVAYDPLYHLYKTEKRSAGEFPRLSLADLRREIRQEPYYIKPPEGGSHRIRGHRDNRFTCWCVHLIEHPMGEQFEEVLSPFLEQERSSPNQLI